MPAPAITGYRARARQEYTCDECGTPILPGTVYERWAIRPRSGLYGDPHAPIWLVYCYHRPCPADADPSAFPLETTEPSR